MDDINTTSVESLIDHHRWLLNNGVANDAIKNQLFMYGSIVHKDVAAVDLSLDVDQKLVNYKIFVPTSLIKKIEKFEALREGESLFALWRFKRFLEKQGNLDIFSILNSFVKDYCGKTWTTAVSIIDFNDYVEDYDGESELEYDIDTDTTIN